MTEVPSQLQFREERLLLDELNHRILNEFASLVGAVSLAVLHAENDETKVALSAVAERLHHCANIHHNLRRPDVNAPIDAEAYLRKLCLSISRAKLDRLKIELVLVANPLHLRAEQCWRLGMIVYELVTNAARHAFAERQGEIRVELLRIGSHVACKVLDNGKAAAGVQPGRGLKIVQELTKGLDGRIEQQFGSEGSISIVAFPYNQQCQEQQEEDCALAESAEIV
jgi:two-component sensor histidine kinase